MNNEKTMKEKGNKSRFEDKDFVITDNMILQVDEKKCFTCKNRLFL